MNTLIITHSNHKKKFQWKKNYNPEDFLSLLTSVFKVNDKITGLKDFRGKTYDLSYFVNHPKEALSQPYSLVLENEYTGSGSHSKNYDKIDKNSSPNKNHQISFKQKFLAFIETMFLETMISEKEYLYLKCLYFEEPVYVEDYFNHEIKDYHSFCGKTLKLLILKKERKNLYESPEGFRTSPQQQQHSKTTPIKLSPNKISKTDDPLEETFRPLSNLNNKNIFIWIEKILKNRMNAKNMMVLNSLIENNDELVFATFKVFENERDEEELIDTIIRITQRNKESHNLTNNDIDRSNNEVLNENPYQRNEEDKAIDDQSNENLSYFKNKKLSSSDKKEIIKENKEIIQENNQPEPPKIALATIFNDFMDETGAQFEIYEFGVAAFLFKDRNEEMIKILKTCQSIELAVRLIKELTNKYWENLLNDNFTKEQIQTLKKEIKNPLNEEIYTMIQTFKKTSKIKSLLTSFKQFLEKKVSENSNNRERSKTGFSNIVGQRILEKKTSFNLTLRRGQSFQSDQKSNNLGSQKEVNQSSGIEIKMIHYGDNAELKEILNRFHDQEDIKNNEKYKETLKEIMEKADFIQKTDIPKYYEQLESNNPAILDICSKYSKNKNILKIKKNLINLLEKEDEGIDFQASPLMKNKVKKLNSFKHLIRELYATSKMITKKQEKLFFYLYMEEDISILSAYEVYRVNEDLTDFLETLEMIGKFHFFKTKLDFDEIEQFDEMVEKQLGLLFAYKRYLTVNHRNNLEKIIRAGDISLLKIYQEFKVHKNKDNFINSLIKLAEEKTVELQSLEKMIKENTKITSVIDKRIETIENFKSTNFLKDCVYFHLIDKLIEQDHILIQSIFEIYHNTKDKGDFIENIKLIYKWKYKANLKEILKPMSESLKMSQAEFHFLMDCTEEEMPHIMGPYEFYMVSGETPEAEEEFKDTLNIILRVYKHEINIFENSFYMASFENS